MDNCVGRSLTMVIWTHLVTKFSVLCEPWNNFVRRDRLENQNLSCIFRSFAV